MPTSTIPIGFCQCGCGGRTTVARYDDARRGWVKGQPIRFFRHHRTGKIGPENPHWRGGITLDYKGYLTERIDGTRKFQHRARVERLLGHALSASSVIHHPDEDTENTSSRLVVCEDQTYHMLLHYRTRAYRATGNPAALRCNICGEWGLDLYRRRPSGAYHRSCHAEVERARRTARGLRHRSPTTITAAMARDIYDANGTQRVIAARFGVRQQTVSNIKTGKTWSHVHADA